MNSVCTDILGPLPAPEHGEKSIPCVQDSFSKFLECYTIPDQCSSTVAYKTVFEFLSWYGCCLDRHSDRASNYQSKPFWVVCHLLEIIQTRTPGFKPMANGMIERFRSTQLNKVSPYVDENKTNWNRCLQLLTLAFNFTVKSSTGYTPILILNICVFPYLYFAFSIANCQMTKFVELIMSIPSSAGEERTNILPSSGKFTAFCI